jgi:hypothetical protein
MPMRGPAAIAERNLTISAGQDPVVVLRIDDEKPADETALSGALTERPVVTWTGIVVPSGALQHMDFWLADLDGYCRVLLLCPRVHTGSRNRPTTTEAWVPTPAARSPTSPAAAPRRPARTAAGCRNSACAPAVLRARHWPHR